MGRVLLPFEYFEPETLAEAIALAGQHDGTYIMGGYPGARAASKATPRQMPDPACPVAPNGSIAFSVRPKTGLRIGAKVVASALLPHVWAGKRFAALREACEQLYPPHVGNMGGGDLAPSL